MPKRKFNTLAVCLVLALLLVGGGVLAAHLLSPLLMRLGIIANDKIVDFHEYYSLNPETAALVWEDARVVTEQSPLYENDEAYLPVSVVRQHMDPFIFVDEYAGKLIVTSQKDVLEFGSGDYIERDGTVYVSADLLMKLYPYRIAYNEAFNLITVDEMTGGVPNMAKVIKKTGVRYSPETNSEMALEAEIDEVVTVFTFSADKPSDGASQTRSASARGEFALIRTKDGLPGYILAEDLRELTAAEADLIELPPVPQPLLDEYIVNTGTTKPKWTAGEKVNMMWDGIYSGAGNSAQMSEPIPAGVNVLSPTWFELSNEEVPSLVSFADADYVAWAHGQGVSVWPRVMDGGFERSHAVLTDREQRTALVEKLCAAAEELDLDGINIDFESVRAEDGDYFIQFLRELSVGLGDRVLSVDVLVPQEWSAYYRRGDIALFADFICVMAYDEHHAASDVSGPVASLPFVSRGITDMLEIVPKEKLIMGLPFFSRIWIEISNSEEIEIKDTLHYGMQRTKQLLVDNGVNQPEWDETVGSFYGEFAAVEDDEFLMYRVWLEDENSIREKLKIFTEHDLAGLAGWSRGFENKTTDELLREACG